MGKIQDLISLEAYYSSILRTYKGGCMTIEQGKASRQLSLLRDQIDEFYGVLIEDKKD
jgi:hypothetical protein